ncbi:hypothetical protein ACOZ4Y_02660 [Komagataeibacter rhaeticus]
MSFTTFALSRALCRLGLARSETTAHALIRCGRVRIDGDLPQPRDLVGYGVTVSVRGIGERVVSRQSMGVR